MKAITSFTSNWKQPVFYIVILLLCVAIHTTYKYKSNQNQDKVIALRTNVEVSGDNEFTEESDNLDSGTEQLFYSKTSQLLKRRDITASCTSGHVSNMAPICGADGCLQNLTGPPLDASTMSGDILKISTSTRGFMKDSHIDTVKYLSQMQWNFGVYGSVGEIGVFYGKYASVLATYTATHQGERFFICDIFGDTELTKKFKTVKGRIDKFEETMKSIGFSVYDTQEPKRIRVFDDSSLFLSKALYNAMKLPTFRFYSIDGNHYLPYVLNDLTNVVCSMREGGIISVDDIDPRIKRHQVAEGLEYFMRMYGSNIILPFLLLDNKIFLCTVSYLAKYMNYIEEQGIAKNMNWCKKQREIIGLKTDLYEKC